MAIRITPGYLRIVRRGEMLDRLDREMEQTKVEAEITALAAKLIAVMGKDSYDIAVEHLIPEDASYEQTRDTLQWLLDSMECRCYTPEMSCRSCQAEAVALLEPDEIPYGG